MAATFNQLLRGAGIDPTEVTLLRHQTVTDTGDTPHRLRQRSLAAFEQYQSTQEADQPRFRRPKYWASFVAPTPMDTMFVGLYETQLDPDGRIDWLDPLTRKRVGADKPWKRYELFRPRLTNLLAEQIDRLKIDWNRSERSWAQHAAGNDKAIVPGTWVRSPSVKQLAGEQLERELASLGFVLGHRTTKISRWERGPLTVYVKRGGRLPIVIHPYYEGALERLRAVDGVRLEQPFGFYANSNLTRFPAWMHINRARSGHYGIDVACENSRALKQLTAFLASERVIETPDGAVKIGSATTPDETEREARCLARIGQGRFRADLDALWDCRCAVTGVALREMLRASHIKPWRDSTDAERLDPYNGLLLGAHLDALFDSFLISFDDEGRLLASSSLGYDVLTKLGLMNARLSRVDSRHRAYLAAHRARLR